MSVINQVLNDLEKRGATALPGDTVIRAVASQQQHSIRWMIVAGAVLSLIAAGLLWKKEKIISAPLPRITQPITTAPAPDEIPAQIATPESASQKNNNLAAPAMRLSFELSTIPLPSNLPAEKPQENSVTPKIVQKPTREISPTRVETRAGTASLAAPEKQIKQYSAQQLLENEYRRATTLVQQGRSNEGYTAYEAILQRDASYDAARQGMVAILLDSKRNADAEFLLQEGLQQNIKHSAFAMLLARLQVERGAVPEALATLNKTLPYADRQADYQAFIAALLQRQNNHPEAIEHYKMAVQFAPNSGVWLMGLGISLHAVQRNDEARDAFKRALATSTLSAELQEFVEKRLKEL